MACLLSSYADVQVFIAAVLAKNGESGAGAPHGAFWTTLPYDQFVNGYVPGGDQTVDCETEKPMPILVKGNSEASNIIQALQGTPETCFGPNGTYGQMPESGPPYFTPDQINEIACWIDAGCPQFS